MVLTNLWSTLVAELRRCWADGQERWWHDPRSSAASEAAAKMTVRVSGSLNAQRAKPCASKSWNSMGTSLPCFARLCRTFSRPAGLNSSIHFIP